jgi:prophage antirepressor-like protein
MTHQISHFYFQHSSFVRVQVTDGEPWFCLKDACEILGISNSRDLMIKQLDKAGVDKIYITDSLVRQQLTTFINEPNLYRVIFRSNKPEARQFQDWVFNDVLPTIRKTGRYEHPVCELARTIS